MLKKGTPGITMVLAAVLLIGRASSQVAPLKHGVLGFTKSPQAFEPNGMIDIFLEDLDSDGDRDAVISSMGPSLILRNDGQGRFTESQRLETVHGLRAGDIDKDGNIDLVAAPGPVDGGMASVVYLNNGRGVFERADRDFGDKSDENVMRMDLLDVNHDGHPDAVHRNILGPCVAWLNDGKGRFERSRLEFPAEPSFADLDGDGFVDILVRESELEFKSDPAQGGQLVRAPRKGERGFRVYLNDRTGSFRKHSFLPVSELVHGQPDLIWYADIDNDGDKDAIYTDNDFNRAHLVGILLNDGTGRLAEGQKLASVAAGRIGTGDLNNDRFVDLVITDWGKPAQVWLNDGRGKFFDSGLRLGEELGSQACRVGDLDQDGDRDVLITDYRRPGAGIWFNQLIPGRGRSGN